MVGSHIRYGGGTKPNLAVSEILQLFKGMSHAPVMIVPYQIQLWLAHGCSDLHTAELTPINVERFTDHFLSQRSDDDAVDSPRPEKIR